MVLAIVGALFLKNKKWQKVCRYFTLISLIIFTNSFIFLSFCKLWEVHKSEIPAGKTYDVGIVLGGMFEYDNDLERLSIRRGGDRIWQAISLYKKGKIKKILISGDTGYVGDKGLHEAKQLKKVLLEWGIPKEDLLVETISKNTHENAVYTKKVLDKHSELKSNLLITSASHMRRAKACFSKVGLYCDVYSTDFYTSPKGNYFWDQYIVPDFSRIEDWGVLSKEWTGFVMYKLMGYI